MSSSDNFFVDSFMMPSVHGLTSLLQQSNTTPPIPSINNASLWSDQVKYSLSIGITSGPFFFIFWTLLIVSIVIYAMKRKEMKRNQHILFIMTIILAADVTLNLTCRMVSEWGMFSSVGINRTFILYYTIMGAIQRVVINYWVWHQLLMMAFLCNVFYKTCKETGAITQNQFTRMRMVIMVTLVGSAIFFLSQTTANIIMSGLVNGGILRDASSILGQQLAIFIAATIMFFVFTVLFSIYLNITGFRLNSSLQESVRKLKEKMNDQPLYAGRERENTLLLKQTALRKTRLMQAGLSLALLLQSCGFLFIPASAVWLYLGNFFFACTNVGLVIFIALMISINTPMQEVQRMFRRNSQISNDPPVLKDTKNFNNSRELMDGDATLVVEGSSHTVITSEIHSPSTSTGMSKSMTPVASSEQDSAIKLNENSRETEDLAMDGTLSQV
ncbi:hypothetical protein C9374_013433 [Naegleria lovaniensis]|uniref:Uncharacterized protein n=1 Tax=Naegleria lovaniensis TaxID=51637 RepID=A0AA88GZC0_NAELO|nr:uncharacterized protein C9374_013433 [Naegleria lovaniensis]KAG2391948.1 hypothetical protein C9374_013433 [Naegleria lovaniensis]